MYYLTILLTKLIALFYLLFYCELDQFHLTFKLFFNLNKTPKFTRKMTNPRLSLYFQSKFLQLTLLIASSLMLN